MILQKPWQVFTQCLLMSRTTEMLFYFGTGLFFCSPPHLHRFVGWPSLLYPCADNVTYLWSSASTRLIPWALCSGAVAAVDCFARTRQIGLGWLRADHEVGAPRSAPAFPQALHAASQHNNTWGYAGRCLGSWVTVVGSSSGRSRWRAASSTCRPWGHRGSSGDAAWWSIRELVWRSLRENLLVVSVATQCLCSHESQSEELLHRIKFET